MSTARKYAVNNRPMSHDSHNRAIAAIQILWKQMRADLRFDKEALREERLIWIADFLGLKRELKSITDLSDKQLGIVLEEMRRLSCQNSTCAKSQVSTNLRIVETTQSSGADVVHLAGEAQLFTINKLVGFIGWSEEGFRDFLFEKFRRRTPRMLTFKKANSLMMILLNIAADKQLRAQGKTKITRQMTAEYIPVLKRKLQIGDLK